MKALRFFLFLVITLALTGLPSIAEAGDAPKIVVLNFPGPDLIKSDDTIGFRIRTHEKRPKHRQLRELGGEIQRQLVTKLNSQYPNQILTSENFRAQLPETTILRMIEKKRFFELGDKLHCRYVIYAKVDFAEFKGQLVTGDKYKVHVSARLIDCQNNEQLWHLIGHDFDKLKWTKSGVDPLNIFFDEIVPEIVDYMNQHITDKISTGRLS